MRINISHIDHVVMTVENIDKTSQFYQRVLGIPTTTFKGSRKALNLTSQKINLHQHHHEFTPHALHPKPGALDLCFITTSSLEEVIIHLEQLQIFIEKGPVETTGAKGKMCSVYIRDPDQNLIEIAHYLDER